MYGHHLWQSMFQPGKVANPANNINITIDINSGQLNGEKKSPCPRSRLRIWPRETGSAVPSRVSLFMSTLRLNLVLTHGIPSDFRGGVHSVGLPRVAHYITHVCVLWCLDLTGDAVAIGIPVGLSR